MILMEIQGLGLMVLTFYLVAHSPAIILLIIGLVIRKRNPKRSRIMLIIAGVYFLIGAGICGSMLN